MVKKLKWNLVLMSVLYLGLGIFLVMKPGTALSTGSSRKPFQLS